VIAGAAETRIRPRYTRSLSNACAIEAAWRRRRTRASSNRHRRHHRSRDQGQVEDLGQRTRCQDLSGGAAGGASSGAGPGAAIGLANGGDSRRSGRNSHAISTAPGFGYSVSRVTAYWRRHGAGRDFARLLPSHSSVSEREQPNGVLNLLHAQFHCTRTSGWTLRHRPAAPLATVAVTTLARHAQLNSLRLPARRQWIMPATIASTVVCDPLRGA